MISPLPSGTEAFSRARYRSPIKPLFISGDHKKQLALQERLAAAIDSRRPVLSNRVRAALRTFGVMLLALC